MNGKGEVIAYACDVGSTRKGNFGWARAICEEGGIRIEKGSSVDECVAKLRADLSASQSIAIGMECPLFIPVPEDSAALSSGRDGDGNRSCFAPAGGYVATLGLHQLAFILRKIWRRKLTPVLDVAQWNPGPDKVLFWEAFVSGKAKAHGGKKSHVRDAVTAAVAFVERFRRGNLNSAVTVQPPSHILSLTGCALLWSGWSDDVTLLRQPVLVVKPSKPYVGEIRIR